MSDEKGYKLADGSMSTDYNVGDTFEYYSGIADSTDIDDILFDKSDILLFSYDDHTQCPRFESCNEDYREYELWSFLIPTQETLDRINKEKNKETLLQIIDWHNEEIKLNDIIINESGYCYDYESFLEDYESIGEGGWDTVVRLNTDLILKEANKNIPTITKKEAEKKLNMKIVD